jgi:hypothetical protein
MSAAGRGGRCAVTYKAILMGWAFLLAGGWAFAQTIETNFCVSCHMESTGNQRVDKNYFQWKDSWHAAKRVTCDKCHGGKPGEAKAAGAHSGMLEAEGKKTASYYLKMDSKCGACHGSEYSDFSASSHYKFLQQGGGPSCITCHHPKTGHTFSVKEIVTSCVDCHNDKLKGFEHVPQVARMLLDAMGQAETMVGWAKDFVSISGGETSQKAWARSKLVAAEMELSKAKKQWHLFNLNNTEAHVAQAVDLAKEAKSLSGKR